MNAFLRHFQASQSKIEEISFRKTQKEGKLYVLCSHFTKNHFIASKVKIEEIIGIFPITNPILFYLI